MGLLPIGCPVDTTCWPDGLPHTSPSLCPFLGGVRRHTLITSESETFDLGGLSAATISTNVTQAFRDPLPVEDMVRITFVTGAGKLGRQKYDEGAAKAVTSALRDLGFNDDRGASCVKECAGSFKLQHDTGKNLKTVVVFPFIQDPAATGGGDGGGGRTSHNSQSAGPSPLLAPGSPEETIAASPVNIFENLVKSRCPSWSQKKGCSAAIGRIKTLISEMEQRLLEGTVLADAEQALYDSVSIDGLDKKHGLVKDMMHHQVEAGNVTEREKKQLLAQVADRLLAVEKDVEAAKTEQKPKKAEKLEQVKLNLEERKAKLSQITPQQPAPLKHQSQILVLRKELVPLISLEDGAKGRLLSVKETQTLARKDDILDEIAKLETGSRGWFEDDDSFQERVERCRAVGNMQSKNKKAAGAKSTNVRAPPKSSNPWMSSSTAKPRTGSSKVTASASTTKSKPGGAGGVFAAMMLDDSDED